MKCDEPLFEDGEKHSSRGCQLELGHSGAHEYFGKKYARPRASGELSLDVISHLEDAIPATAWGVNERSYPVMVEATSRYVVWVDAESEDEALAYWADDPTELDLKGEMVIDGELEVQRLDRFAAQDAFQSRHHGQKIGPQIACPGCGVLAMRREWYHDPMRKCHGPIKWRESNSPSLRYRYSREIQAAPVYDAARKAVAA
ncbi:hypothetical protein [Streptomyces sp. NPDC059165]|uniref:hypothetical protein n=1 Tax=Streptomyces sp. NPDC059165 TaxID=3346751 RepID=UPI0036928940